MQLISRGNAEKLLFACLCSGAGLLASNVQAAPAVTGYVMDVQLVPAVCSLDPQKSRKRKCLEGYSLNIAGLYPEGWQQRSCSASTPVNLPPIQAKVVARVMPDEHARSQLWQSIGSCVPMNASQYFRTIINYAEKLKVPEELTSQDTRVMQAAQLRSRLMRLNPSLPSSAIELNCQQSYSSSILTEIKICYKNNGQYKACPSYVQSSCPNSFTIKGSF